MHGQRSDYQKEVSPDTELHSHQERYPSPEGDLLNSRPMQETGAKYQADYQRTDYVRMYPFEETESLIERGLIKKAGSNSKSENVSTGVIKVDSQNAKVMKETW